MVSIQTIANFGWELLSCTAIDAIKVCEHTAERHPIPLLSLLTTADLLKLWSGNSFSPFEHRSSTLIESCTSANQRRGLQVKGLLYCQA